MNKFYPFILFLTATVVLSSCSSIYMPNVPTVALLNEKGEAHLAAHINLKGNVSGTAAIAVTDHLALAVNGSTVDHGVNSNEQFTQKSGEIALGYYTKIGKNKSQNLEFYAGYGIGNTINNDKRASIIGWETVESREMDFEKMFLQVNFAKEKKNKINVLGKKRQLNYGTSIRLSKIGSKEFTLNGLLIPNEENYFIEPLFFTRLELSKGLQLQYTNGFNIPLLSNEYIKASNSMFTLGVVYNFWK